jgi:hypothetical protein
VVEGAELDDANFFLAGDNIIGVASYAKVSRQQGGGLGWSGDVDYND